MKVRIKQMVFPWMGALSLMMAAPLVQAQGTSTERSGEPSDPSKSPSASRSTSRDAATSTATSNATSSAKDELVPHALMVEASLQNSLVAAKALQAQEKSVSNPGSKQSLQHAQMYQKMLNQDLKTAMIHSQELQGAIQKYPELAKSDSYQGLQASLNDLNVAKQMWVSKLDQQSYLSNKNQVNSDLDKFQKSLKESLDKVSNFSKHQLNIESDLT